MTIAITGSSGFIGSCLVRHFLDRGNRVVLMQRRPPESLHERASHLPFDLRNPLLLEHLEVDALIHCAFMPSTPKDADAEEVNIAATLLLRDYCRQRGIRFLFLSTMSAHAQAESVYGRHKFRLEQMLEAPNETVLRLGLVIGSEGGLFRRITYAVNRSPVVPLVDGGHQPVQTVAVEDVCIIAAKCIDENISGHFLIGAEKAITLRELYQSVARHKGRRLRFISLPYFLFDVVLSVLALLPLNLPISKENLLGLKHLRSFDTAPDLARLAVSLRPLEESLR
jgi:nucleoside-diphosphate-sugar epimerase